MRLSSRLKDLFESNPGLETQFMVSISKAAEINPDKFTNPVQSLDDYYKFLDHFENSLPWEIVRHREGRPLIDKIMQSLIYFYFLIDQESPYFEDKDFIRSSLQYHEPVNEWLRQVSKCWGLFYDSELSWNKRIYNEIYSDPSFGLSKGWYEDPTNWKTFNQFFARKLFSPNQRPISDYRDKSVVVSPVDGQPQGLWSIDDSSNLSLKDGLKIKSSRYYSVSQLLGDGCVYKNDFADGTLTHLFLAPNDYHRFHFPLDGKIVDIDIIEGQNLAGGKVGWDENSKQYVLDPSEFSFQCKETRGRIILKTENFGLVALLPVGMAHIASINFNKGLQIGLEVRKGDEIGCFYFGGSDFVVVFQKKVRFSPNFKLESSHPKEASFPHFLMGEKLGSLS